MNGPSHGEVVARLQTVTDPCSLTMGAPIDVWSLGLVESIDIDGGHVRVGLVLTDFACVYFRNIRQYVQDAVGELDSVEMVDVELIATVLWTPDRMRLPTAPAAR